ncbi:MAG: outer membrane protein assembly factor BamD [Flammeovirgaceae bacterium]|nr:outer membrane protein assembly factor BamD [Flammeovirgaceae bacterium]
MKKNVLRLFVVGLIWLASCSPLTRVLKNPDINEKYQFALEFYENEDYYRAGLVFEDLLPNMAGKAEAENVQFYYSYCQYYQNQFDLAAYYFKQFYDTYRRSDFAEEALYMHAYSNYKATPDYNLDQSNTTKAIETMQDFMNRFPKSSYFEKAGSIINELRGLLEKKAYSIAKQYHRLRRYQAAVIACDNFQKDFPDSELKEEVSFIKMEAQYEYAKASIYTMKIERYEETMEYYYYLVDRYPNSEYMKMAESYFKNTQRELYDLNP